MRLFPKSWWRIPFLLVVGATVIGGVYLNLETGWWPRFHPRVSDKAHFLPFTVRQNLETHLEAIYLESGIDVRFIFLPSLSGESLEEFSVRRARSLGIGQETGRRGLLFVYDLADQRLRIEVGAKLEGIFPDGFIGYLIRNNIRSFFEAGDKKYGIQTTLLLLHDRIRQSILGQEYDPRFEEYVADIRRLALGGGATSSAPVSTGAGTFLNKPTGKAERLRFVPQPTVEDAYQRYLEWSALDSWQPYVSLFTGISQDYLDELTMTPALKTAFLSTEFGRQYKFDIRGDLALQYFTNDPLAGPYFYRRTNAGWQMDVYAEVLDTRNYIGGPYSWGITEREDDFTRTFADRFVLALGMLRINGGDNRALPLFRNDFEDITKSSAVATSPIPYVEHMDLSDAFARIAADRGSPMLLVLYQSDRYFAEDFIPRLIRIADTYVPRGLVVEAYSVDNDESARRITGAFERHPAPFPVRRIRPWTPGQLGVGLERLGITIGVTWGIPLVAVLDRDGTVLAEAEGVSDLREFEPAIQRAIR